MRQIRLISFAVGLLSLGVSLALRAIDYGLTALFRASDPRPLLVRLGFSGSWLAPAGFDHGIDAATYQRNRHEAGLARLGAVRHT